MTVRRLEISTHGPTDRGDGLIGRSQQSELSHEVAQREIRFGRGYDKLHGYIVRLLNCKIRQGYPCMRSGSISRGNSTRLSMISEPENVNTHPYWR